MSSSRAQKLVAMARGLQHLSYDDKTLDSEEEQVIEINNSQVTMLARVNQDPVLKYYNTASSSISIEQIPPDSTANINEIENVSSLIQPEDLHIVENSFQSTMFDHALIDMESQSMYVEVHPPITANDSNAVHSIELHPTFSTENLENSTAFIMEPQNEDYREERVENSLESDTRSVYIDSNTPVIVLGNHEEQNINTVITAASNTNENNENQSNTIEQQIDIELQEEIVEERNGRSEIGRPRRGRKRKIEDQPRKERKRRANVNEKYVNAKGKEVLPKIFDENFHCNCKKKCTAIISIENRKKVFDQFWSLGSYEGRCAFICGKVKQTNKARCYTDSDSRRKYSRQYFIFDKEICKKAFLKTLGICQSRIDVALLKKYRSSDFKDNRGAASGGNNKTSEENIKRIIDHINSFPKYVSHYCRDKTDSRYLNTDLNLSKMYDLFKSKYTDVNDMPSLATYKKIFYEKFNLRFKPPKSDTCKTCDKFAASIKSLTGTYAEEARQKRDDHVNKAYALRNKMNADLKLASEDESIETLTFDMQKTHPLPKIPTNVAYYKRQLNLYNLGIYVGSNKNSVFNLWLEYEGGKGTQEVGSCLRKYILNNIQPPVTKLFLWADSCGGQNRSIKLVLMLIHTMQHHPSLKSITLRFLLSGHSFLPNDANFGVIETQLKTQQRLYTVDDYAESIKTSKKHKKFEVCRMDKSEMLSVKPLEKIITNRKIDSVRDKVNWLNVHEIVMEKDSPYVLKIKNDIGQENAQVVSIEKAGKGRKASIKNINLPECWPEGKSLSKEKIKDLKELMKLVPADAKPFYDFLKTTQGVSMEEDVDGYHVEDIEIFSEEED